MLADNHCRITGPIVEDALQKLGNAPAEAVLVQVFDCFHVPKVRFDHVRQRFYPLTETLTIHATAQVRQTLVYTLHDLKALIMCRKRYAGQIQYVPGQATAAAPKVEA